MMRPGRKPMTIPQMKRSMDRQFRSLDRRLRRTMATKADLERVRKEIGRSANELRKEIAGSANELHKDMAHWAEETRRHFDVVAESLRDDLRIFADGIARHSERLDQHETQIARLGIHGLSPTPDV